MKSLGGQALEENFGERAKISRRPGRSWTLTTIEATAEQSLSASGW